MATTPIIRSTGSVSGPGTAGQGRNDLVVGESVLLEDIESANSGATRVWSFEDTPINSVCAIASGPTPETKTFEPDVTGSYRIRCVVNGIYTAVEVLAVPLARTGARIPSFMEQLEYDGDGNTKGWHEAQTEFMREVDDQLGAGGGHVIQEDGSALTARPSLNFVTGLVASDDAVNSRTNVNLANTAVTPGAYTNANITVDQQGRVTLAANGSGGTDTKEVKVSTADTTPAFLESKVLGQSGNISVTKEITGGNEDLRVDLVNTGTAATSAYPSSITTDTKGRVTSVTAGSAPTDEKVAVATGQTAGYLEDKLQAGTNITLTTVGTTPNKKVQIDASGGGTDEKVKVDTDQTAGFLFDKISAGTNVAITKAGTTPDKTVQIAVASAAPSGSASGDLSGTYPSPAVAKLTETTGPTSLTIGAVADGQYLKRDGTTLIGAAAGGGHTIQEDGTPLTTRANLNFSTGLVASDDSGNSATKVDLQTLSPSPSGSYTNANVTVDAHGRITVASSGAGVSGISLRVPLDSHDLICLPLDTEGPTATVFDNTGTLGAAADFTTTGGLADTDVMGGVPGMYGGTGLNIKTAANARIYSPYAAAEPTTELTVSGWFFFDKAFLGTAWPQIIGKAANRDSWSPAPYYLQNVVMDASSLNFVCYNGVGSYGQASVDRNVLPYYEWVHLAMTYDGANVKGYVNGSLVASTALTGSLYWYNSSRWSVSCVVGQTDQFGFRCCDIRISDVARSASYLLDQYKLGSGTYDLALNEKLKISSADTTSDYLINKVTAGTGITLTKQNAGANETLQIASAPAGSASGDLSGTYPSPAVSKLTETAGPTSLTIGAIADGEFLKRSGSNIISAAGGGSTPSSAGSVFSMTPPTGATAPVVAYDFTKWNPALTELQNVAAANQSGVSAYNITAKGGTASHGYFTGYNTGYTTWPYAASSNGACLRMSGVGNYWRTNVVTAPLLLTGTLTIEVLTGIAALPASGQTCMLLGCASLAGDEGKKDNYLYSLGFSNYTLRYVAEYGSGTDIIVSSAFACQTVPAEVPTLIALTRQADGAVKFYVNGHRVSDLIAATIPDYEEPHTQIIHFINGYGSFTMLGARIFNTELTEAQIRESYNRTMFGYA